MNAMQQQQQQQQSQGGPAAPNGVAGGAQLPTSPSQVGPASGTAAGNSTSRPQVNGGRFDFDDGGTFCGGWEDGKAHGHGVCTGPKGQGAYSGSWHYGFEVSGVYTWPSGSAYEGQWQNGKRHGLGMETRGRWIYRGEWTQGFKGRYGVRQSTTSNARYEGTWSNGLQDGYGSETYADSGTYQGQWLRGMRHGYGVRTSAPFGLASHYKPPKQMRASLTSLRSTDGAPAVPPTPEPTDRRDRRVDDSRGGFVLKARSDDPPARRKSLTEKSLKKGILSGLKIRKQRSTGDLEKRGTVGSIRSNASSASWMSTESSHSQASASVHTDSNASFVIEDEQMDASVTETYLGEWKNDKRTGFGISERSDGLRYEGEWFNNRKYGYGVTTFRDGTKEEGKYKNNVLITSQKKKHIFLIRSAKFRERIDAAVNAAVRSSRMALQKSDIAISRTATARGKAELADIAAEHARQDSELAQQTAKQFAPDFREPGLERLRNREIPKYVPPPQDTQPSKSILSTSAKSSALENTQVKSTDATQGGAATNPSSVGGASAGIGIGNQGNSTQTFNQSLTQSIRRASMKPMTNQIPLTNNNNNNTNNNTSVINPVTQNAGLMGQYGGGQNYGYGGGGGMSGVSEGGLFMNNSNAYAQNVGQFGLGPLANTQQVLEITNSGISTGGVIGGSSAGGYLPQHGYQFPNQQGMNNYGNANYNSMTYQQMQQQQMQQQVHQQQQQQQLQQQQQQLQQNQYGDANDGMRQNISTLRRNSRVLSQQDRPNTVVNAQSLNDRLDHYKRPPSRDSSVDRYRTNRLIGSRQPSVDKQSQDGERTGRGGSIMRSGTPLNGSAVGSGAATPTYTAPTTSQFEGALRRRGTGQEIIPSAVQPKRTESLYVTPARGSIGGGGAGGGGKMKAIPVPAMPLQRKKSLPDVAQPIQLTATSPLSREEVSVLSSMRREEIRRQIDESERLRANPLLYLVSPQVKDWFSRQQLVMIVLFINISLALMFFKLLT
ncbi:AF4/FMR2 family member lilli isoform X2 [Microplitis demolitor]|uniref:AF4/FMR2 family member lilli isoform X2 n=1 Tax=Microplitis demolitor TaxID=69319 RepID=UPI0004CD045E|nr:AF4/FMR2 family member lilli isoform X2 [Microplitis demolitor]